MTDTDIRLKCTFRTHPKRIKLQRKLGADGVLAFVDLLMAVGEFKPSGDLSGLTEEDIAILSGYQGDIKKLISTLLELRFLDDPENLRIHEWDIHQPWVVRAPERINSARKAAQARWDKQLKKKLKKDEEKCDTMRGACEAHAESNAPFLSFPFPSSPSLSLSKDKDMSIETNVSTDVIVPVSEKPKKKNCPHKEIVELYHKILTELPRVKNWPPYRQKLLQARWGEKESRQDMRWWERFFNKIRESDFLMGRTDHHFRQGIEWFIRPINFNKVLENIYQNRG